MFRAFLSILTFIFLIKDLFALSYAQREGNLYVHQVCFVKKDLPANIEFNSESKYKNKWLVNNSGKEFIIFKKRDKPGFIPPKKLNKKHLPIYFIDSFDKRRGPIDYFKKNGYQVTDRNFLGTLPVWDMDSVSSNIKNKIFEKTDLPKRISIPLSFYYNDKFYEAVAILKIVRSQTQHFRVSIDSHEIVGEFPEGLSLFYDRTRNLQPDLFGIYHALEFKNSSDGRFVFVKKFKNKIENFDLIKNNSEILYYNSSENSCYVYNKSVRSFSKREASNLLNYNNVNYVTLPFGYTDPGERLIPAQCSISQYSIEKFFPAEPKKLNLDVRPVEVVIPPEELIEFDYKLGHEYGKLRVVRKYSFNSNWVSKDEYNKNLSESYNDTDIFIGRSRNFLDFLFDIWDDFVNFFRFEFIKETLPPTKVLISKPIFSYHELVCL